MRGCDVLVCDDDDDLRESLVEVLVTAGFQAKGAGAIPEALKLAAEARPSVVLLDLDVAGSSASEFVRKNPRRETPIVLLSGADNLERHQRQLGANAAMRKPVAVEELTSVLARFACGSSPPI